MSAVGGRSKATAEQQQQQQLSDDDNSSVTSVNQLLRDAVAIDGSATSQLQRRRSDRSAASRQSTSGSVSPESEAGLVDEPSKGKGKKRRLHEDGDDDDVEDVDNNKIPEKPFFTSKRRRRRGWEKSTMLALRSVREPPPKVSKNPRELRRLGIEGVMAEEKGKMNPLRDPALNLPQQMEKYPRFVNRTDGRDAFLDAPQMGLDVDDDTDQDGARGREALLANQGMSDTIGVQVVSAEHQVDEWLTEIPTPAIDASELVQRLRQNEKLVLPTRVDLQDVQSLPLGAPTETVVTAGDNGGSVIVQQLARSLRDNYHLQHILSPQGVLNEEYILETPVPPAVAADEDEEEEAEDEPLFLPAGDTNQPAGSSGSRERDRKRRARLIYQKLREQLQLMVKEREDREEMLTTVQSPAAGPALQEDNATSVYVPIHGCETAGFQPGARVTSSKLNIPTEPFNPPTGPRAATPASWRQPQQQQEQRNSHRKALNWPENNEQAAILPRLPIREGWSTTLNRAGAYGSKQSNSDSSLVFTPTMAHNRRGGLAVRGTRSSHWRGNATDRGRGSAGRRWYGNHWRSGREGADRGHASNSGSRYQRGRTLVQAGAEATSSAVDHTPTPAPSSTQSAPDWTKSTWYKDTKDDS